jgi:hypothetical protein
MAFECVQYAQATLDFWLVPSRNAGPNPKQSAGASHFCKQKVDPHVNLKIVGRELAILLEIFLQPCPLLKQTPNGFPECSEFLIEGKMNNILMAKLLRERWVPR